MWINCFESSKYSTEYVPEPFQSQELYDRCARRSPRKVPEIPIKYQTKEMWKNYIAIYPESFFYDVSNYICDKYPDLVEFAIKNGVSLGRVPKKYLTEELLNKHYGEDKTEHGNKKESKDSKDHEDLKLDEPDSSAESQKPQTLRQKFDINNEEDFDKLLAHYAQVNKAYYSTEGKKSEEDIKQRRNINAQMKRILNKKAMTMPQNENGEEFTSTLNSIESGNVFSYEELKQVAESKKASIELFNIMASGVYEKDGQRIRLTQKQRVALASTLEIVSGMRMDMDKAKKAENKGVGLASEVAKNMEA